MNEVTSHADLAGMYITDERIDIIVGYEDRPRKSDAKNAMDVMLEPTDTARFPFSVGIEEAFRQAAAWIVQEAPRVRSLGVACYGPFVSLNHEQRYGDGYGQLRTTTHGLRLSGLNLYKVVGRSFPVGVRVPMITVETDVNAAALGEMYWRCTDDDRWLAGWENEVVLFLKISVGIGGGAVYGDGIWGGRLHSEMGHIRVPKWCDPLRGNRPEEFPGVCRYHRDCVEGLASVPAMEERWGMSLAELQRDPEHIAWEREAHYIGQLCTASSCILVPSRIVLGGRVMNTQGLLAKVQDRFREFMGGEDGALFRHYQELDRPDYIDHDSERTKGRVGRPGVWGAFFLAALIARPRPNNKKLLSR